MLSTTRLALAAVALAAGAAGAQTRVLVLSSDDPGLDSIVQTSLQAQGLTVTVGPSYDLFTSAYPLGDVDVVYLQANYNWTSGPMSTDGQQHLLNFVQGGGGLVTCEWVMYYVHFTNFAMLEPIMPVTTAALYHTTTTTGFNLITADPVMTAGVASNFQMNLTSYAGTEVQLTAKPGATTFFTTTSWGLPEPVSVAGWNAGSGRTVSFATVNGNLQFDSPDFVRLLGNAMRWTDGGAAPCYPDCNGDTVLNLSDFGCFTTKFALGNAYADCNGDTVLNLSDFGCFTTKFALGCP